MDKKYINSIAVILSVGVVFALLASLGFNVNLSISKERIEVSTNNSNSANNVWEDLFLSLFLYLSYNIYIIFSQEK